MASVICAFCQYIEATEAGRFLDQMRAAEEGLPHFFFHTSANLEPRNDHDHAQPLDALLEIRSISPGRSSNNSSNSSKGRGLLNRYP
jgi:hypothetical protein